VILIDFNAIAISNIMVNNLDHTRADIIKHQILNSIRMYNLKFRKDYGTMVICCDARSWRKNYFKEYKYKRKEDRDKSAEKGIDWNALFEIINGIREDLQANFPYSVVYVDDAEADDIIGVLVERTQEFGQHEKVMIVSGDKDFIQLHRYSNVKQFAPVQKKQVKHENPIQYLREHIIRGDKGDGVPSMHSHDTIFVEGGRQKPISKKFLEPLLDLPEEELKLKLTEDQWRNYVRNKNLVDLSQTPSAIVELINDTHDAEMSKISKGNNQVLNYLITNRMRLLIECVGEFL